MVIRLVRNRFMISKIMVLLIIVMKTKIISQHMNKDIMNINTYEK